MQSIHPLWYICLSIRTLIFYYLLYNRPVLGQYIVLISSIGYFYQYINHTNDEIQIAKVFWNNDRPIHGVLMILLFLFYNTKYAPFIFLIDLLYSLVSRFIK